MLGSYNQEELIVTWTYVIGWGQKMFLFQTPIYQENIKYLQMLFHAIHDWNLIEVNDGYFGHSGNLLAPNCMTRIQDLLSTEDYIMALVKMKNIPLIFQKCNSFFELNSAIL